jgi:integrase/recombinase XerD
MNHITDIAPLEKSPPGALATSDFETILADFLRLNLAEGDAAPHTLTAVYSGLNIYAEFCEAQDLAATAATADDIREYRAWLIDKGDAPATVAARLWAVRKLFAAAVWRGWRQDNPGQGVKPPKDRTNPADKIKFLPYEGYKCLVNTPDTTTIKGRRDRAIMVMLALHGLRVNEAAILGIDDIEGDKINVLGKGSKLRAIYLTDDTRPVLAAWLKDRAPIARDNTAAVFVALGNRSYGRPMTTRGIRHMIDGYLVLCGLKADGISCHSLRHSFATWARYFGASARSLQYNLGHAKPDQTNNYIGAVDRIKDNPAQFLGGMLE